MVAANDAQKTTEELQKKQLDELEEQEGIIDAGLHTFYAVGNALLTIRDKKLYKALDDYKDKTFGEYCKDRFRIGTSHSYRLIDSARVVDMLQSPDGENSIQLPTTEAQVRPLVKLKFKVEGKKKHEYNKDKLLKTWKSALDEADDSQPTAEMVRKAVAKASPPPKDKIENVTLFKASLNQVAAMLKYAKLMEDENLGDNPLQELLKSQTNSQSKIEKILEERKTAREKKKTVLSTTQDAKEILIQFARDLELSIEDSDRGLLIQGCKIIISKKNVELKSPDPEGNTDTTDSPKDE